jgi:hypothetical protein
MTLTDARYLYEKTGFYEYAREVRRLEQADKLLPLCCLLKTTKKGVNLL